MSKKTQAFRPAVSEPLENRTVLSGFGGFAGLGMAGGFGGSGAPYSMDNSLGAVGNSATISSAQVATTTGGGDMSTQAQPTMGDMSGVATSLTSTSMGGVGDPGMGGSWGGGGDFGGQGLGVGGQFGGGNAGDTASGQAAQAVSKDFQTLATAYNLAIYNDLQAPSTPNTSGFTGDATVAAAFKTLSTNLGTDVASLAAANPNLATALQSDVTTLQTTLSALTVPANASAVSSFQQLALQDIGQTLSQATQSVDNASPPAGTVTDASLSALQTQINTALQTFNTAVSTAYQAALPASATSTTATTTTTTTTASPASFSAAVTTAATALSTSITSAVTASTNGLPTALATSLNTTLTADVTNLQSSLTSLTVPTSATGSSERAFASEASDALSYGEGRLTQDVSTAVQINNESLNPVTTTPATTNGTTATPTPTPAAPVLVTPTTVTATSSGAVAGSHRFGAVAGRLASRMDVGRGVSGHARRARD